MHIWQQYFPFLRWRQSQWLMLCMALAMAGIVWVQARWVGVGLNTQRALRLEKARSAAQKLAEQLQYTETTERTQLQFREMADTLRTLRDALGELAGPVLGGGVRAEEDAYYKIPRSHMRMEHVRDTLIFHTDTLIMGRLAPRYYTDTTYVLRQRPGARPQDSLQRQRQQAQQRYQYLLDSSRRVLDRVFVQMIAPQPLASHQLDSLYLAEQLHASLAAAGIHETVNFSLLRRLPDGDQRLYVPAQPAGSDSVVVQLFTRQVFTPDTYLTLYLPPNYVWLLLGMCGEIGLSMLLLLCLWALFAYTLRALRRQKRLSAMKTDFINNMTHELKTPLATIGIAAEALYRAREPLPQQRVQRYAGIIQEESQRLSQQVTRVLQTVELKHGRAYMPERVALQPVFAALGQQFMLALEQAEGQMDTHLAEPDAHLLADPIHLHQVLANLIDNALKYAGPKPRIVLQAYPLPGYYALQVVDQGPGMDAKVLKHIFEPFYRSQTGNRQDTRGYGLGLSYVQSVMLGHNGRVEVQSQLGRGTTFTLFFPHDQS
ncbi:MAG: sensor histidine kinase [Sphingobacteriia bacterium]